MVSTMQIVDTIEESRGETPSRGGKRKHSAEFKAQVVRESEKPGASIAAIALAHGVNANLVHKWRSRQRELPTLAPQRTVLLPVTLTQAAAAPTTPPPKPAVPAKRSSPLELEIGGVRITVREGFDVDALRAVVQVLRDTAR